MRPQAFRKAFGGAVRAAREEAGISQRELASRVGIAGKYLSRIELGMATPSVLIAAALAREVGVGLDALVGARAKPSGAGLAAIAQLLSKRSADDVDRALRVMREMLR